MSASDAFHVDHLDQLTLEARYRRQISGFGAKFRRRMDIFHRNIDDALHTADQKSLDRAVELGHHQIARAVFGKRVALRVADGQAQVQHRHRAPAHIGNAGELGRQAGDLKQIRAAQHFLHLEDVHAKKLAPAQPEQQQGQSIVASQTGALVDAVEQIVGHGADIDRVAQ